MQESFGEIPLKFLNYFTSGDEFIFDKFYESNNHPRLPKNHFMLARMVKKITELFDEVEIIYDSNNVILGLPITVNNLFTEEDQDRINLFNDLFLSYPYYIFTRHYDGLNTITSYINHDRISLMYSNNAAITSSKVNLTLYKNNYIYIALNSRVFGRSGIPLPDFLSQDNDYIKTFGMIDDSHLEITASFKIYFDYFGLPDINKIKVIDSQKNTKTDEFFKIMTTSIENYYFSESFLNKISRVQANINYDSSKLIYNLYGLDMDEFPVFVNKETGHMFFLNNKIYLKKDLFQPTGEYIIQKCNNITFNGPRNKTIKYFDFDKDNVRSFEATLKNYISIIDNKASDIFEELYKQVQGENSLEKTISFLNLVDKHVTRGQVNLFNSAYADFMFDIYKKYDFLDFNLFKKLYSKLEEEGAKFFILRVTTSLSKRFETVPFNPYSIIFNDILQNDTIIFVDDKPLAKISRRIKDFVNSLDTVPKNVNLIISQKPILLNVLVKTLRKNGVKVIDVKDIPVQKQPKIKKTDTSGIQEIDFSSDDLYIQQYSDGRYKLYGNKIKTDIFKEEKSFVEKILNAFGKRLKIIPISDYRSLKNKPVLFDSFVEENKKEIILKIKETVYNNKYGIYFEHWITNAFYNFNFFYLPLKIQDFFRDIINKVAPEILILRDLAFKYNDKGILDIAETAKYLDSIKNIKDREIPRNLFNLSSDELELLDSEFTEFNRYEDKNELYSTLNRIIYQETLSFIIKYKDKFLIDEKIDLAAKSVSIRAIYFKSYLSTHVSNTMTIRNGLIPEKVFEQLLNNLSEDKNLAKEFEITLNRIKETFSNNIARLQYY